MRQLITFISFYAIVILLFGLISYGLLRFAHPSWWQRNWIRKAAYFVPPLGIIALIIIGIGENYEIKWLISFFAPVAILALIMELAAVISLPFSGVVTFVNWLVDRLRKSPEEKEVPAVDGNRRVLLKGLAAAIPLTAMGSAATGFGRSFGGAKILKKEFAFENLPPALDGLKLLQISDSHLRQYVTLSDLEDLLTRVEPEQPDLILVTGDIADDLDQLPGALSLIDQLKPRLGSFASLGNHEHFRGVGLVKKLFDRAPVPLLIDQSVRLNVEGTPLVVSAIDDPVSMRTISPDFFETSLETALFDQSPDEFTVLMSHRPTVFPHAAARGIELTLSGHTHGGQIGLGGRSVWENSFPENFLWGEYRIDSSRLYTTCGMGHWFPFRLGCPCEAPLITLRSA